MKTLTEIIKPYFVDRTYDGDCEVYADQLALELISSGLVFEGQPERKSFDATQQRILDDTNKDQFSDGHHTFNELYEIRKSYNVALFNEWAQQQQTSETEFVHLGVPRLLPKYDVHKSWRHHDGELCFGGGWFIVVAVLPSGQISNHYEAKDWDLFKIPETEKAKYEWDGHTTQDVINRLKSL